MNNFFSQSSLRDYIFCPYKYKLKYIDKIYWFQANNSDSLKSGLDFHQKAERYFSEIPNIDNQNKWLNKLKKDFPINKENTYLSEYNLNYNENGIKLKARYDLIILKNKSIDIIDFKTNKKKLNELKQKDDIQTKVYTFVLANCLSLFQNKYYSLDNLSMTYWQPDFSSFSIPYSLEKHVEYKMFFSKLINNINNSSFEKTNNCNLCEFNSFCSK